MKNIKFYTDNIEKLNYKGTCGKRKSFTGYASIDKPWLANYPVGIENAEIPSMSIYQLLRACNSDNLNSTVLEYFNFSKTYRKYFNEIESYARALKGLGVQKGDIVALALPNVPECRELIYALNILGAIAYPINPSIAPAEFSKIVSENNIKNVFMFNLFYQKFSDVLKKSRNVKNIIVSDGKESIPKIFLSRLFQLSNKNKSISNIPINVPFDIRNMTFSQFSKYKNKCRQSIIPVYEPNSTAVIVGTSGTTGVSKGVCLTNENLNAMALQHLLGDMNISRGDVALDILIQSIGYGIAVAHYTGVCGVKSVLIPTLETHIFKYIKTGKFDHFTGGPIHYDNLLKDIDGDISRLPKMKTCVSGGASLPRITEQKLNSVDDVTFVGICDDGNIFVRQGLGCTENGGAATFAKKRAYKFGGVGVPLAFENMGVFVPGTDTELKMGELGELCISGPTVMKEYLNNPTETEQVLKLHRDGKVWLHTCDLGTIDEDGQVFLTDRIKDIFMRRGFNVHPSTVTQFLDSIDIVDSSKVIGVSHPEEQMVPVAFVKLKDGVPLENAKERILKNCFQGLEEPSIPYDIFFVDEMPHNLGGKIDGNYLLEISQVNYDVSSSKKDVKQLIHIPRETI